jgi:hypothetical protein
LSAKDLADVAARSVERALQARKTAGIELSPEQIDQVSGALTAPTKLPDNRPFVVYGGIFGGPNGPFYPGELPIL